jgi:hypothetical protein
MLPTDRSGYVMSSLGRRWAHAFADPSGEAFAALVSPAVELDGCVFARPLHGRHAALTALATAAGIYDVLSCRSEAADGRRLYTEWSAMALGMRMDGVTILCSDDQGLVTWAGVDHRPLAAVLTFSAEMARRLGANRIADHFYAPRSPPECRGRSAGAPVIALAAGTGVAMHEVVL